MERILFLELGLELAPQLRGYGQVLPLLLSPMRRFTTDFTNTDVDCLIGGYLQSLWDPGTVYTRGHTPHEKLLFAYSL